MKRLYLETNYIVGQAFSQDPPAAMIISESAKVKAQICLPSICVQEALATVENQAKRTNEFDNVLRAKTNELRADQSATAKDMLAQLNQLTVDNGRLANERQLKLQSVLQSLSAAQYIHVDAATTNQAVAHPLIPRAATDNLILHAVIEDAARNPATDMAFYTLNTKDFDDQAVAHALAKVGVIPIFSAAHVAAWLNAA